MGIIILDLDNCISDDSWRIPRVNWKENDLDKRFADYHKCCEFDEYKNRDIADNNHNIVIFTSRPEIYTKQTEKWLKRNGIGLLRLYMRPAGNYQKSVDLKSAHLITLLYHDLCISNEEIVCAYDDRIDIVEMYRQFGINTECRYIHNIDAMEVIK